MRKLTLDIDALCIQSFETSRAAGGRGTVQGHARTLDLCGTFNGCGSEIDACPSALGCTLWQCDTTYCTVTNCQTTSLDPEVCASMRDDCIGALTEVDCV